MADLQIHRGLQLTTISPRNTEAQKWLNALFVHRNGLLIVPTELLEEILKLIEKDLFTYEFEARDPMEPRLL